MSNVFGVLTSKITKNQLLHQISAKLEKNSRLSLYFLYSEFVIRANRLPAYKEVLNQGTWTAIDGRGLMWSLWSIEGRNYLAIFYAKVLDLCLVFESKLPKWGVVILDIFRITFFLGLFILNLILNLIVGAITISGKFRFIQRTKTETILGRDFVWDLLQIAQDKSLKVAIVGGSIEGDKFTKHLIKHLFPKIELITWVKPRESNLISDIPKDGQAVKTINTFFPWVVISNLFEILMQKINPKSEYSAFDPQKDILENLSSDNVCQHYPDLWDAKDFLRQNKPNFILLCLGGGSGKQEFFAQHIKNDSSIDFGLITGLGAAIDYLGGEKLQPPKWVCQMGLEWVFRLIHQPYRRLRIIDDIFTLWWWTSLQQFVDYLGLRHTVVGKVSNKDGDELLVKHRSILPGDVGWGYVQGGVEKNENVEEAIKREIGEEASLETKNLQITKIQSQYSQEIYSLSLARTILMKAKYQGLESTLIDLSYIGNTIPKSNWENLEARWIPKHRVLDYLSQEKKIYYNS